MRQMFYIRRHNNVPQLSNAHSDKDEESHRQTNTIVHTQDPIHLYAISSSRRFPSEGLCSARQAGNPTWRDPPGYRTSQKHSQWDNVRWQNGQKVVEPNSGATALVWSTRTHDRLDETICSWVFQWRESEWNTELAANFQIRNRTMSPFISAAEEDVSILTGHKRPLHLWITQLTLRLMLCFTGGDL